MIDYLAAVAVRLEHEESVRLADQVRLLPRSEARTERFDLQLFLSGILRNPPFSVRMNVH